MDSSTGELVRDSIKATGCVKRVRGEGGMETGWIATGNRWSLYDGSKYIVADVAQKSAGGWAWRAWHESPGTWRQVQTALEGMDAVGEFLWNHPECKGELEP